MKLLVVAALLAVAAARPEEAYDPTEEFRAAGIVRSDSTQNKDGSFQYTYETAGADQESSQDVSGRPEQIGDKVGIVSQGSFTHTSKDEFGNHVVNTITWKAGPKGFEASGPLIPVAPEDPNKAAQDAAYAAALSQ